MSIFINIKRGQAADGILMMYRLFMVLVVAFAVFSLSGVFYKYTINVREVEAHILSRDVSLCLAPHGIFNLSEKISEKISECGVVNGGRLYVKVVVFDEKNKSVAQFSKGDSGKLWVQELFGKVVASGKAILGDSNLKNIQKYNPGYYKVTYPVFVLKDGRKFKGSFMLEVFVNYNGG